MESEESGGGFDYYEDALRRERDAAMVLDAILEEGENGDSSGDENEEEDEEGEVDPEHDEFDTSGDEDVPSTDDDDSDSNSEDDVPLRVIQQRLQDEARKKVSSRFFLKFCKIFNFFIFRRSRKCRPLLRFATICHRRQKHTYATSARAERKRSS